MELVELKPLNEELQKIAVEELGEVPSRIPKDLQDLKLWIEQQPHLKARTDDQFLIQFLRGCKYSLERAKEKLDLYFTLKYPEMLNTTNVDDTRFREMNRLGCLMILPEPINGTGPRIVVFQYNYSTSKYSIEDVFQPGGAMHEILMVNDPYACIQGLIYIVDLKEATASHYLQMTPNFAKKLVSFLEKSLPLRIKSVYYINTSAATQQYFKILLPFFSEKLRQRVHIIGSDLDELINDIPLQYLPRDYGGAKPSMVELNMIKYGMPIGNILKRMPSMVPMRSYVRLGKPLDLNGLFGIGGSLRILNVD